MSGKLLKHQRYIFPKSLTNYSKINHKLHNQRTADVWMSIHTTQNALDVVNPSIVIH